MSQSVRESEPLNISADEPEHDWRNVNNGSIFFDNRTFSSLEEMKGSLLEACCSGDSVYSGALGLITTAATPSMLSLPLAFVIGGWCFADICIVFCIIITFLSVRILALASVSADSEDYETVTDFFLGTKGRWCVRLVLFLYNFGSAVVYLSFIKDSITPILVGKATFLPDRLRGEVGSVVFLIAAMFVITPLTFNSRLASLRTKGLISNAFTIFILISVTYRYFMPLNSEEKKVIPTAQPNDTGSFGTSSVAMVLPYLFVAPIFIFSYELQSNVMAVIKDLHDRSGRKIASAVSITLCVITIFYVMLGVFGSLSFPNLSSGNILSVYDSGEDTLMLLCQLFCCFSASISFVFSLFPCRLAAFMFLSDGTSTKIPKKTRVRLGISLSAVATLLAIFLPDVARMVSILGALFSATLSMTFPALFSMKMRKSGTYLTGVFDAVTSWILLFAGVGFSVSGTVVAVLFS